MILGYILAGVIGLSLGLLGGGGSILTVPILVYVVGMETKLAVALSLAIVGTTTLFGAFGQLRNKNFDFKVAIVFGVFAIPSTFLGTYLSQFVSGALQLFVFALVMVLAAIFMLRKKDSIEDREKETQFFSIFISGLVVGLLTGFIGVGGGFLIVPALIFFTETKMRKAIGTSLFIITINSFVGFASYANQIVIPWEFLLKFTGCSILGVIIGSKLVNYIPQKMLQKAFAIFLIVMGSAIAFKNIGELGL